VSAKKCRKKELIKKQKLLKINDLKEFYRARKWSFYESLFSGFETFGGNK
jgi:hypothetical protein